MPLRSTVYWGSNVPDGQLVEIDEETEVESILDASNTQPDGPDPMDICIEEPIGRQSHGQGVSATETFSREVEETSKMLMEKFEEEAGDNTLKVR